MDDIKQQSSENADGESRQVEQIVMAGSVIVRKWHEGNQKHDECTLQELWENGFYCGQAFQEHNKHFHKEAIPKGEFYATQEFLRDKWKAFWNDLSTAEIIIREP